jgi:hypothetical protein
MGDAKRTAHQICGISHTAIRNRENGASVLFGPLKITAQRVFAFTGLKEIDQVFKQLLGDQFRRSYAFRVRGFQ